ncbi:MAG: hypothetical protein HY897_06675 [Deltaproteobacteria bacterium]|nr:hypothetical protein [Deltaproteobacteria bacterium]
MGRFNQLQWIHLGGPRNEVYPVEHPESYPNQPAVDLDLASSVVMDIFRLLSPELSLAESSEVVFSRIGTTSIDVPEWARSVIHVEKTEQYGPLTRRLRQFLRLEPGKMRFDLFVMPKIDAQVSKIVRGLIDSWYLDLYSLEGIDPAVLPTYFNENDPLWQFSEWEHGWSFGCRPDLKEKVIGAIRGSYKKHGKKAPV